MKRQKAKGQRQKFESKYHWYVWTFFVLMFGLFPTSIADARVTKIVIDKVESPTFEGQEFGPVGKYEKLIGRVFGEVDPNTPENIEIVNLDKAPKTANGHVLYSTDLYILKPIDLSQGNSKILYGVLNRGNKLDLVLLNNAPYGEHTNNPTSLADIGNSFLMRHGYTVVWSGWQAQGKNGAQCCVEPKPGVMHAELPIPLDGTQPIIGSVRDVFVGRQQSNPPDHQTATLSYPVVHQIPQQVRVDVRAKAGGEPPQPIPFCVEGTKTLRCWNFVDERTIRVSPSFDSGQLYEVNYTAKDPIVLGLGFAITRDVVSFLRYQLTDDQKNPNPLRRNDQTVGIEKVFALGISQAGRYLQEHLVSGFNQDEHKRVVFDGLLIDIAGAGKTFTNFAFGQPGRTRGAHQDYDFPENWFPFAYGAQDDLLTGKHEGLLRNNTGKTGDGFDPLVMVTNTATEYWRKSASLLHTDVRGNDVLIPDNVRLYFFASTQHFPLFPRITTSLGERLPKGACQQEQNPAFRGPVMRALLAALDEWATKGTPPPETRIPTRQSGTLVTEDVSVGSFPTIPGVVHIGHANPTYVQYGTVTVKSPQTRYVTLVPKTDADGNDLSGIVLPDIAVPLGTHTGWAVRGDVPGAMCGNLGQFIPFAYGKSQRNLARDPRLSLTERYPQRSYVNRIQQVVNDLQTQRLLLPEDAAAYVVDAQQKATTIFTPPPSPPKDEKKKPKRVKKARKR